MQNEPGAMQVRRRFRLFPGMWIAESWPRAEWFCGPPGAAVTGEEKGAEGGRGNEGGGVPR